MSDPEAVEAFKEKHYLSDDDLASMQASRCLPSERFRITVQPTTTFAIGCAVKKRAMRKTSPPSTGMMWSLRWICLKSQEINLDYILELIFEHNKKTKSKVRAG